MRVALVSGGLSFVGNRRCGCGQGGLSGARVQVLEVLGEMPGETPVAFGFHPNAEIGFKLREGDAFCNALILLQPRDAAGEGGLSSEERARMVLEDVVERLPDAYDMEDIRSCAPPLATPATVLAPPVLPCGGRAGAAVSADPRGARGCRRVEDLTPYTMVAIQEAERMNVLTAEMRRSLAELGLGLRGDLTMSEAMETLQHALAGDAVPASWRNLAYPSLRPLGSWLTNVQARAAQLNDWTADLAVPKAVWLSGLFNPQSFLTAVMQTTARRNDWPLDKTVIVTEVTKKLPEQVRAALLLYLAHPHSHSALERRPRALGRGALGKEPSSVHSALCRVPPPRVRVCALRDLRTRGGGADARRGGGAGGAGEPRRRAGARPHAGGRAVGRQGGRSRRQQAQGALLPDARHPRQGGHGGQGGGEGRVPVPRVRDGGALPRGDLHRAAQEQGELDQVDAGGRVHVPGRGVTGRWRVCSLDPTWRAAERADVAFGAAL